MNSMRDKHPSRPLVYLSLILVGSLFASSCSNVSQEKTGAENIMEEALREIEAQSSSPAVPIPDDVAGVLMQGTNSLQLDTRKDERFDISVNQVPARTFFLSLVSDSGINVVAHPEVAGEISLELKNVTVREALDVTRDVYGYEYKFNNNIYTIYPRKLRTEVFPINYLDVQRVGVSDTGVLIGTISSSSGSRSNGGNSNSNSGGNSSNKGVGDTNLLGYADSDKSKSKSSGSSIAPGARVQTLNKTNFWHSIQKTVESIIGAAADSQQNKMVMVNPQAGLVVVTALPRELSAVRDFLERSELSVKRQVVLETKIVEVRLHDGYEAGINWGAISGSLRMESSTVGSGRYDDIIFGGIGTQESSFSSLLEVVDITKLLKLLETQGHVQVLSSPRISTVNNQKAVIRVGSDEFFVTGISNSTTSSAASIVSTPEIDLDSFFSGIALDVTPQIAEDGDVILHIHPIVSSVSDQVKDITVGANSFSLPLALRDIRESDSIVRAKSGQVVVLGGLMQELTTDEAGKQPFLGNIPGVNVMFKKRNKQSVKTELVILMRPVVVNEDTWKEDIAKRAQRVGEMSNEYRAR